MKTSKEFTESLAKLQGEKQLEHQQVDLQSMALQVEIAKLGQMELIASAMKKDTKGAK
jgi:hypothetical protein